MGGSWGIYQKSGLETFDYQRLMGIGTVESGFNGDFPGLYIYIHIYNYIYIYMCVCVYIYIYIHIRLSVSIYIYIS